MVLHYCDPWMSNSDIQPGDRWSNEVARQLQLSNFGILCVTAENLSSPWILFEAGALAKSVDEGRVVPLLFELDFSSISGPLAQFQAKKCDQEGLSEIVVGINKGAPQPIDDQRLSKLLDALVPKFYEMIKGIPADTSASKKKREQGEILEDVVSVTRSTDQKIDEVTRLLKTLASGRLMTGGHTLSNALAHSAGPSFPQNISLVRLNHWLHNEMLGAPKSLP